MDTTSDLAVAESHSVSPAQWLRTIDLVTGCFTGRFTRVEPRRAAAGFVTGLLTELEIKTSWQLAEQAGLRQSREGVRLVLNGGDAPLLAVAGRA